MLKNTKKIKIASDLDGVIIDHTQAKIEAAQELGHTVKPNQIHSAVLKKLMPKKDYRTLQSYIYEERTLSSPPIERSVEKLTEIMRVADLYIISRRTGENIPRAWLKKHLPNLPQEHAFFVRRDEEKDAVMRDLNVSIYIDDKLSVLELCSHAEHLYLFDEHNTFEDTPPHIDKARHWDDLHESIVKKMGH